MKKIVAIGFVCLLVVSSLGYYPFFRLRQEQIRSEMKFKIKKGVPESELHEITFPKDKLPNWTKKGKEFKLNNHLYDIVRTAYTQSSVIYYCVDDTQEAILFAQLDEIIKSKMNNDAKANTIWPKIQEKSFTPYCLEDNLILTIYSQVHNMNFICTSSHLNFIPELATPPPRF